MARMVDLKPIRFNPSTTEAHHSTTIGAALFIPYLTPGARTILVQASTNDIRYTLDGSTPTAALGFMLIAGNDPILIELTEHVVPKFFGTNANSMLNYCLGGG